MQMKKRQYNYKVHVEYGNGKEGTFFINRLTPVLDTVKRMASDRGTSFIQAQIYPQTWVGRAAIRADFVQMNTLGNYCWFKNGQKIVRPHFLD